MKRILFVIVIFTFSAAPTFAEPSLHFSTKQGMGPSWTLAGVGAAWAFNFNQSTIEVDQTNPSPDPVLLDLVDLPSMVLSNIVDYGAFITATVTPSNSLTIKDNTTNNVVMRASIATGGMVTIGTTYVAFAQPSDDMNITSFVTSYSGVIDAFATGDSAGSPLDLSFTGSSNTNLYNMIKSGIAASATGSIEGQMNLISTPAPGAILLGSIGVGLVGWLRRRKTL